MAHAAPPAGDWKRLLNHDERRALELFEARCGRFGEHERRTVPLVLERSEDSQDPDVAFTVKGHAAVFNRKSLDLGGFQEKIDPGAFTDVLDRNPDVHLVWDHSTTLALARTLASKYLLELREDPKGLHYYAKVAPTSFAADLRILMEGGVIDQASFAFTVDEDVWEVKNRDKSDEYVLRTIRKIGELFDVTITAQGAYPQTDSQVVRAYAMAFAQATGRLPDTPPDEGDTEDRQAETDAAPDDPADVTGSSTEHRSEDAAPDDPADTEENAVAQVAGSEEQLDFKAQKMDARLQVAAAKTRYLRTGRKIR